MYRRLHDGELVNAVKICVSTVPWDNGSYEQVYPTIPGNTPDLDETMRIRLNNELSTLSGKMSNIQIERWLGTPLRPVGNSVIFSILEQVWNHNVSKDPYDGRFTGNTLRPTCEGEVFAILEGDETWLPMSDEMRDSLLKRPSAGEWNMWLLKRKDW